MTIEDVDPAFPTMAPPLSPAYRPADLVLREAPFGGPEARALIDELQQEYVQRYGEPDETPVRTAEFEPPDGIFLIATLDGQPVGCAGLRRHDDETVELKRMFVRAPFRRRGLARVLLVGVESRAARLGYRRVILETGTLQPEAIELYLSHGYRECENLGHYRCSPLSRAFTRDLS